MSNFSGGSYALNPNTGEYELVERTFDPAEVLAAPEAPSPEAPTSEPNPEPTPPTSPAKRSSKTATEE